MAMKKVAVFRLPFSFMLIVNFVTVTVSFIDIDMEKCSNCTGRADVPCVVQHSHLCQHPMYSPSWPGAPQDLTAKSLKLNGKWFANFSWKPPYDSSLKSLEGFHLTVNVLFQEISGIGHPDCFFINLTQVDWTKVEDKHNVEFHFDCISSENPVTVFLMVTSSPAPSNKAQRKDIAIQLPGVGGRLYEPNWNVTINVRKVIVNGCPEVHVRFEPLYPTAYAHIVSVYPLESDEAQESVKLIVPENYTVFKKLPSNKEYFVLLKPEDENNTHTYMWKANGSIFIQECDPIPPKPPENYLALIIVGCIFLVVIATSCTFCLIRTRHNGRGPIDLFVICKARPCVRYTAAATGEAPNNLTDFASETKKVLCVLHSNSPKMKQACLALRRLLQMTCTADVLTTEEIFSNGDLLNNTHRQIVPLLILDNTMMQLWKDDCNEKSIDDTYARALANIIRKVKDTHCLHDILFVSLFSKEQKCWRSSIQDIGNKLYYICSERNDIEGYFKLELNPADINELLAKLPGSKVNPVWMGTEVARMLEGSIRFLALPCEDEDEVKREYSMSRLESASAVHGERYCSWSSSLSASPSPSTSASSNESPHRKANGMQMVHPENECSLHYPNDSGHVFHGKHSTEKWVEQQSSTSSNFTSHNNRVKSRICSTLECPSCQTESLTISGSRLGSCVPVHQTGSVIRENGVTILPQFPKREGYNNGFILHHNSQVAVGKGNLHSPSQLGSCNARSGQINPGHMTGRHNSCEHGRTAIHSAVTGSSAVKYENGNRSRGSRMGLMCDRSCHQLEEFMGPDSDEESMTESGIHRKLVDFNKRNGYLPKRENMGDV